MRLHTDLTANQVHAIAHGIPGVYVDATQRGSRSRARAFDFHLVAAERPGRRRSNTGDYGAGDGYAATWDEWGIVFARLFALDPDMTCYAYDGTADYHFQTADRFRTETFTPHDQHRWVFDEAASDRDSGVWQHACSCGAVKRYRHRAAAPSTS